MAHMYPPEMLGAHGSEGERAVFEALRGGLSDDFYCYHSKQLMVVDRVRAREGEIDFVILHRERGLLALEVKGGGLARDGRGRWYTLDAAGGRGYLDKDPFEQVSGNLHTLVKLLRERLPPVLPSWSGEMRLPFLTNSAPTPLGPFILCPEIDKSAAPHFSTSTGIFPQV